MEKNLVDGINFDQEWTRKGFHGVLHTFFPVAEFPIKSLKDYYGDSFSVALFFVSDDYVNWYWNSEDMRRLGKSLIKKVDENPGFLDKLLADWHKRLRIFDNCSTEAKDFINRLDKVNACTKIKMNSPKGKSSLVCITLFRKRISFIIVRKRAINPNKRINA